MNKAFFYFSGKEHMEGLMKGLIQKLKPEEQFLLRTPVLVQTLKQTVGRFHNQIISTLILTKSLEVASFQQAKVWKQLLTLMRSTTGRSLLIRISIMRMLKEERDTLNMIMMKDKMIDMLTIILAHKNSILKISIKDKQMYDTS